MLRARVHDTGEIQKDQQRSDFTETCTFIKEFNLYKQWEDN